MLGIHFATSRSPFVVDATINKRTRNCISRVGQQGVRCKIPSSDFCLLKFSLKDQGFRDRIEFVN